MDSGARGFSGVVRIRDDKSPQEATTLAELSLFSRDRF
jgi:hypothetical protein